MNGRVNIIGHNDVDKFLLYETPNIEKSSEYKNALVGNFETSVLSKAFFSADNIDNLQKKLASQIYDLNNIVINYAVPQLYKEAKGYLKYKQHVSNISNPIDLPKSSYHSNTLIMKPFF